MPTCNTCKYVGRPTYKSPCSECKEFSKYEYENKKTNADCIRSMSDEELAKALYGMQKEVCTHIAIAVGFLPEELDFADESPDILNWLQQPFEGE